MSDGSRQSAGRRAQDQVDLVMENERLRSKIVELELVVRLEQALRARAQDQLAVLRGQVGAVIDECYQLAEVGYGA